MTKNEFIIEEITYKIIEDLEESFDFEMFENRYTDYFHMYDYVVGDIAYGKLRLKGFFKEDSEEVKSYNNIKKLKKYINENCAYGCKYFVLERISDLK